MRSAASAAAARDAAGMHAAIERFLKASQQPHLLEPGEELLPLKEGSYSLDRRDERLTIQAWSDTRNLTRRIVNVCEERRGRLELVVERFARQAGPMFLIDMARPESQEAGRRGSRLVFREHFRRFLTRQFPAWKLAEVSAEQDLQHSLSPVFPRAFLRRGSSGIAAIGAAPDCIETSGILSFGLIWLDYLRRREPRLKVERLILLLPAGGEASTCQRIAYLDPALAAYEVYAYTAEGHAIRRDPGDYGNLDSKLEIVRRPPPEAQVWVDLLRDLPDVEQVANNNGAVSLRAHGVEFARTCGNELLFGLGKRAAAREWNLPEIRLLASELALMRCDPRSPLHDQEPEEWLAAQVRTGLDIVDASLRKSPVYSQAPAWLGSQRGVIDLLAVDYSGRLAALELKASQDLHLPLQALDYWMRVKWRLDRDEFSAYGYFPGIPLRKQPPRMLLISPALEFHPTSETILQFFSAAVDIERIGVGANWRRKLQVMFRLKGSAAPA
ncbi:MAG TPA: hypothetical protein VL285_23535 [Bryobacteraceae bacterium]|nr:hypothetical protein [Bryobacteraceae bacterium]